MFLKKKSTKIDISKMSDEECLKLFLDLIEKKIEIQTGFVSVDEEGPLTHQVMQVSCGEWVSVSQPEPLDTPLTIATAKEVGASVN